MATTKVNVILKDAEDWLEWIEVIKSAAIGLEIWEYIDPATIRERLPKLEEPVWPTPATVKTGAKGISELDEDEKDEYKSLKKRYNLLVTKYETRKRGLGTIRTKVQETVTRSNLQYTFRKDSPYDMLVALRDRYAPSDATRTRELKLKYEKVKTSTPNRESIDDWLQKWEVVYTECLDLGISDVLENASVWDFVRAVDRIQPEFANIWIDKLLTLPSTDIPDLYKIVHNFRLFRREKTAQGKGTSNLAMATFKGISDSTFEKESELSPKKDSTSNRPTCFCQQEHFYKDCPYINNSNRPNGWRPDPDIQKRLDNKLEKDFRFKRRVEAIRRSQKKDSKDTNKTSTETKGPTVRAAMYTIGSSYCSTDDSLLRDSFLLDSASESHVCNSRDRFTDLKPAPEDAYLKGGGGYVKIEGFGTVVIKPEPVDEGDCEITLHDVAFAPMFPVNLVSYTIAMSKRFFWDGEKGILVKEGQPICKVVGRHNHWLLEYNPIPQPDKTSPVGPETYPTDQSQFPGDTSESKDDNPHIEQHSELDNVDVQNTVQDTEPRYTHARKSIRKSVAIPRSKADMTTWHRRMGHLHWDAISHLPQAGIGAVVEGKKPREVCQPCQLAAGLRQVSRRPHAREKTPFTRVYYDLIQMPIAYNGDQWITHLLDEATYTQYAYTHKNKNDTLSCLEHFRKYIKHRYGRDLVIVHLDGERTLGSDFDTWTMDGGILPERTAPDTPDQNGPSERSGGVIVGKARRLRIDALLPEDLWPEFIRAAVYLMNRSPTRVLDWQTPIERLGQLLGFENAKPNLFQLKVYGCRSYARIRNLPRKRKMAARALIGYLIGYEGTNIFRIWIPQKRKVIRTRDVTFNEEKLYDPRQPFMEEILRESSPTNQVTVEIPSFPYMTGAIGYDESDTSDSESESENFPQNPIRDIIEVEEELEEIDEFFDLSETGLQHVLPTPEPTPEMEERISLTSTQSQTQLVEIPRPRQEITSTIDTANIIEGRTRRTERRAAYLAGLSAPPHDLFGYRSAFTTAIHLGKGEMRLHRDQLPEPPSSWNEMMNHSFRDQWLEATKVEYDTLWKLNTFRVVPLPKDVQVIPVMWTFVYKFDTNGFLIKFKARICARGDKQQMTLADTYASTLAAKTFRALMGITAVFGLVAKQWDVVNAFCQATMDEIIHVQCPPGYRQPGNCLLLLKPLYGLRRSPLMWYKDLSESLKGMGLVCLMEDMCIFSNEYIVVLFFVDDIIPIYHSDNHYKYEEFKVTFQSKYETRDMGDLKWFLGIRVIRDLENRKLWLCQDSYVEKITHRFHLEDRKVPPTPMSTGHLVKNEGQATPQEVHLYQQKVGSLLYVTTITRPDAAKAASKLSEFLLNPSARHLEAVDRAIAYLYGTRHLAIQYGPRCGQEAFTCSSDAAFSDHQDRKSSDAYLFSLFGGPIDWRAGKQKTVTTSSTEAELLGLSQTAKETYWWKRLFRELGLDLQQDITIQCDNTQTITLLTKNAPELATKLKHVDIHRHWLRQEVQNQNILLKWIPTNEMPADGLTKALTQQNHTKFVGMLNLQDIKDRIT
jgi:reverse transcriptase-like protein/Pol polyprotein/gag-pre-integrase-like protein